jgi:carboxypeptidase T
MALLRHRLTLCAGIGLTVAALYLSLGANIGEAGPPVPPIQGGAVVRVYFGTQERLNALANRFDIWEVNRSQGYAVIAMSDQDIAALKSKGLRVEVDQERTDSLLAPADLSCYRPVEQIQSDLQALAAAYPNLVELIDFGDSWEKITSGGNPGYDLWALKLTNKSIPGPKPRFFLMAEIHARELTTPETAMMFVNYLLGNYGANPDATWLLDYNEIHVAPMTNPDGHKIAEQGYLQRKNTNNSNGGSCSVPPTWWNQYGTDLNRNADWKWGVAGSSSSPCNEVYLGPTAASEPETQALQNYILSLFPDQRGPNDSDPAPDDATGIMITLHSYGNLVLWPWGHTDQPAPNAAGLAAIGQKFAKFNGYRAGQSGADLYLTSGTTDDYTYGQLGVAAFTFEVGTDFFQDCSALPGIEAANLGALLYAARIARTPYLTARGPDARNLALLPTEAGPGDLVTLTAQINDTDNGNQTIAGGEASLDTPPWVGEVQTVTLTPADGAFDNPIEAVQATLDTTGLADGRHTIFVRGQDSAGYWGPVSSIFFSTPLYIKLASFTGMAAERKVTLRWTTAAEADTEGFNILRTEKSPGDGNAVQYVKLNSSLIPAQGNANTGATYTYVDDSVTRNVTYLYVLEDVDTSGRKTQHGPIEVTPGRVYLPVVVAQLQQPWSTSIPAQGKTHQ